ncbi:hypothetical protein HYX13_04280 [Candidatus Woesearchaeota archaeon]|nr:hypothetical protein [Candidatus Woesearchaeota archaeon]
MAQQSAFRGVIEFFGQVGLYDIVLPFLLVFTILFAILEKTKILGIEKVGSTELPKKNINAMVAFVVAFLVIASTQLVSVINTFMANIVLLLILGVSFLLLVGVFFSDKQFNLEEFPKWKMFFMVLMFIGIVVIFLHSMNWLKYVFAVFQQWDATWAATFLFLIIILAFMWYVVAYEHKPATEDKKK